MRAKQEEMCRMGVTSASKPYFCCSFHTLYFFPLFTRLPHSKKVSTDDLTPLPLQFTFPVYVAYCPEYFPDSFIHSELIRDWMRSIACQLVYFIIYCIKREKKSCKCVNRLETITRVIDKPLNGYFFQSSLLIKT